MIARELDIAEGTVKVHVKHLLKKLNLRSRVEAAVWADREPAAGLSRRPTAAKRRRLFLEAGDLENSAV